MEGKEKMKGSRTVIWNILFGALAAWAAGRGYVISPEIEAAVFTVVMALGNVLLRYITTTPIFKSEPTPLVIGETAVGEPIVVRAPQGEAPMIQVEINGGSRPVPMQLVPIPGTTEAVDSTAKPGEMIYVQTAALVTAPPKGRS